MNRKTSHKNLGIAACAFLLTPTGEVQLFPVGKFRSTDGRPDDAPHWYIDAELASAVIADFSSRKNKTVIDYEHQTLMAAKNGMPAPAAAWISALTWRDDGLYATDAEWTERAASMITSGEYKYISPVFIYDKRTGAVKKLLHAALTNNPALDGMDAVAASQFAQLINQSDEESLSMNLLEQLRWMLNLAVTATEEEVVAELQKAIDQIKTVSADAAASESFSIAGLIKSQADQIAALSLSVNNPDPAKFVAVSAMKALHDEVAALRAEKTDREVNEVVQAALTSGKILPAQEDWARQHGKENLASLKKYLETAQPVAALTGTQTDGKPPAGGGQLDTQNASAIAEAARKYQSEQADLGITVTTSQAVNFVTKEGA